MSRLPPSISNPALSDPTSPRDDPSKPKPRTQYHEEGDYQKVSFKLPVNIAFNDIAAHLPPGMILNEDYGGINLNIEEEGEKSIRLTRFLLDAQGNCVSMVSTLHPFRIAFTLEKILPSETFLALKTQLAHSPLDLNMSERDQQLFLEDRQTYQDYLKACETQLIAFEKIPRTNDRFPLSQDTTRGVSQGEYGIVHGNDVKGKDAQHIIASYGAKPCILVAAFNRETKTAMLAHIDTYSTLSSLRKQLQEVKQDAQSPVEIHLAGGDNSSKHELADILMLLKEEGGFVIKSNNTYQTSSQSDALAIDAENGETTDLVSPASIDMGKHEDERAKLTLLRERGTPLVSVPDHFYKHPALELPSSSKKTVTFPSINTNLPPEILTNLQKQIGPFSLPVIEPDTITPPNPGPQKATRNEWEK